MNVSTKILTLLAIGFLGIGVTTGSGWAAIFYVTSASDGDCSDFNCNLQAALTAAQSNGQDDVIQIAQGTYTGNFSYVAGTGENYSITLEGGWGSDFASRFVDPSNTILDGNNAGRVLTLDCRPNITNGSIKVEGLTLRNGRTIGNHGGGFWRWPMRPEPSNSTGTSWRTTNRITLGEDSTRFLSTRRPRG